MEKNFRQAYENRFKEISFIDPLDVDLDVDDEKEDRTWSSWKYLFVFVTDTSTRSILQYYRRCIMN